MCCEPPRHRPDLRIPADLVEEVARIHGYDRLPSTLPASACEGITLPPRRTTREATRSALAAAGFGEVMTYPLAGPEDAEALRLPDGDARRRALRLVNPIQSERPWLRTQLVASLLRSAAANRARQQDEVRAFELARVFRNEQPGALPAEPIEAVALLARGSQQRLWAGEPPPLFFEAKPHKE